MVGWILVSDFRIIRLCKGCDGQLSPSVSVITANYTAIMWNPPSTCMIVPVIPEDKSLARNSEVVATSL